MRGRIDTLTKDVLRGWAWNPARPADRLRVRFMIDGVATAAIVADALRQDLKSGGIGDGGHGVRFVVPAEMLDDSTRSVVLQVVDGNGDPVDVDRRPVTFQRQAAGLKGRVEGFRNERCIGWVWDQDQPRARVSVHAFWGGKIIANATAHTFRRDLLAAKIGDGGHGFEMLLPASVRKSASVDRTLTIQTSDGRLVGVIEVPAENRVETLVERGKQAYRDGDKDAARAHFDEALGLASEHVDALWMRARIALEQDDKETGRTLAQRALDLHPGHQRAVVLLARLLSSEGDHQAAAALWRQVKPGDMAYRESLIKCARSLQRLGQPVAMIKPGLNALALNAVDLDAHRLLADAYLALGSGRLAERHLRALALAHPDDRKIANQLLACRRIDRPVSRIDPGWEIFENPTLRNWAGAATGMVREATEVSPGVTLRPVSRRGRADFAVAEPQEFCAGDLPHYGLRVTARVSPVELVCRLRPAAADLLSQGVHYYMDARSTNEQLVNLRVTLALEGTEGDVTRRLLSCKVGPRPRLFAFKLLLAPEEAALFATGRAWVIIRMQARRGAVLRVPRPLSRIAPAPGLQAGAEGPSLAMLERLQRPGSPDSSDMAQTVMAQTVMAQTVVAGAAAP